MTWKNICAFRQRFATLMNFHAQTFGNWQFVWNFVRYLCAAATGGPDFFLSAMNFCVRGRTIITSIYELAQLRRVHVQINFS